MNIRQAKMFSLIPLTNQLANFLRVWQKLFDVPTFNCLFPLGNGVYQAFVPSLVPNWVGRFGRSFLKNFFAQNTKTAEKPDKQGVFSGKNFFEIFLI